MPSEVWIALAMLLTMLSLAIPLTADPEAWQAKGGLVRVLTLVGAAVV